MTCGPHTSAHWIPSRADSGCGPHSVPRPSVRAPSPWTPLFSTSPGPTCHRHAVHTPGPRRVTSPPSCSRAYPPSGTRHGRGHAADGLCRRALPLPALPRRPPLHLDASAASSTHSLTHLLLPLCPEPSARHERRHGRARSSRAPPPLRTAIRLATTPTAVASSSSTVPADPRPRLATSS